MATKKQSSGKQSKGADAETEAVMDANIAAAKEKEIDPIHVEPDFAALESRVAQADAAYAAAVSSVGATADELREARVALREARGG